VNCNYSAFRRVVKVMLQTQLLVETTTCITKCLIQFKMATVLPWQRRTLHYHVRP